MTGTIRANRVGPSAGGTLRSLVRGVAAAWVNFNGTGTLAVRDSENVSSVTDVGTGDYTVNITNDMANANYNISATCSTTAVIRTEPQGAINLVHDEVLVGSFGLITGNNNEASTVSADMEYVMASTMGDLA